MQISQPKINELLLVAIFMFFAPLLAVKMTQDIRTSFLILAAVVFILTVQHHHALGITLPLLFFNSAFVIPFLPGVPYVWEVLPIVGCTGLVTTYALGRQDTCLALKKPGTWLGLLGIVGYVIVLLHLMKYRGFGMRILGTGAVGGRFYVQQLVCATFPFIFLSKIFNEKIYVKCIIIGQILAVSYVIPDLVLMTGVHQFLPVLYFLGLPTDSVNFYFSSMSGGIVRLQSLGFLSISVTTLMAVLYKPRDLLSAKGFFLALALFLIVSMGLISGHRSLVLKAGFIIAVWIGGHQLHRKAGFVFLVVVGAAVCLTVLYAFTEHLPYAVQRSVSFLPGIQVNPLVELDAQGTLGLRRTMRHLGWEMIPQYFWVGAGFTFPETDYFARFFDPTVVSSHLQIRRFYNGFIGLMVNTGIFGTLCMFSLLLGGTLNAVYIIRRFVKRRYSDLFGRAGLVIAALWIYNVFFFIFLHGDSETAMKNFALQFAELIVFVHFFLRRDRLAAQNNPSSESVQPKPALFRSLHSL